MKRLLLLVLAILCLALFGCSNRGDPPTTLPPDPTASTSGSTEDPRALEYNASIIIVGCGSGNQATEYCPMIISSRDGLARAYEHYKDTYSLEDCTQWHDLVKKYDDAFFASKTLILFPTVLSDPGDQYEVIGAEKADQKLLIRLHNHSDSPFRLDAYMPRFCFVEVNALVTDDTPCEVVYTRAKMKDLW